MSLEFRLNGRPVRVPAESAHIPLLDFVRSQGLTGAKEGCAEGECGACAVALVEPDGTGSRYRPVNSCLMPLALAADRDILTVEGMSHDEGPSEPQIAMAACGGSQCGYCTPGFVVSLFCEYYRRNRSGACDPSALAGNLCRCTGYRPIRDAAASLGQAPFDGHRLRLEQPALPMRGVSIPGFSRPTSLDACLSILENDHDATVIAGATDLAVEANLRARRWTHLVSLDAIDELRGIAVSPERVMIGAAAPLADIGDQWPHAPAAIGEWLGLFASPLIRNRATLGGNLATASPIGDAAPLLMAVDARVHTAARSGRRSIPVSSFFTGYRRTVLERMELITAVEIPLPLPRHLAFYKVARRRLDDISTVAAAFALDLDGRGRVERVRLAFGGVAPTPLRAAIAEEAVAGRAWNDAAADEIRQVLDGTLRPLTDHRGSAKYRLEVSKSLVGKFRWEHAS